MPGPWLPGVLGKGRLGERGGLRAQGASGIIGRKSHCTACGAPRAAGRHLRPHGRIRTIRGVYDAWTEQ